MKTHSLFSTFTFSALALLLLAAAPSPASAASKPNVVFVMVDDLGWNDVGYQSTDLPFATPNWDRLSAGGVRLDQYYTQPVCTPARASLMSGRFSNRAGVFGNSAIGGFSKIHLNETEVTMAQSFKLAGYQNYMVGKWHLGFHDPMITPIHRGFDSFYGFWHGGMSYITKENGGRRDFSEGISVVKDQTAIDTFSTFVWQNKVEAKIDEHLASSSTKDKPFFMYYAMQNVHDPMEAPSAAATTAGTTLLNKCDSDVPEENRRGYCKLVVLMDEALGQLEAKLKAKNVWDNTIVVVVSDNGGGTPYGYNNPQRGSKGTLWQGGIRVPGFVAGGKLPASSKTATGMIHVSDWLPTLLGASGVQRPSACALEKPLDGQNLWDMITSGGSVGRSEIVFAYDDTGKAIIKDGYKMMLDNTVATVKEPPTSRRNILENVENMTQEEKDAEEWYFESEEEEKQYDPKYFQNKKNKNKNLKVLQRPTANYLFKITDDPSESVNLYETDTAKVAELTARLDAIGKTYPELTSGTFDRTPGVEAAVAAGGWVPWLSGLKTSDPLCGGVNPNDGSNGGFTSGASSSSLPSSSSSLFALTLLLVLASALSAYIA